MTPISAFRPDLFAGRTVVVSGATSGIGLDIARGFARLGANVTGTGSSAQKLAELAGSGEPGIAFEALDVRSKEAITAFASRFETIDVLVNAAGIARPVAEWDDETFLDVIDVNLVSQFRLASAFRPALEATGGAVVNFASMLSYLADTAVPAYAASKTGVLGLTRTLAHAWGPQGIRVNAVAPGYHKTDMTKPIWSNPDGEKAVSVRTALKRWGTTEDLVGAVLFLCSPAATYITGTCLDIDGGFLSGNPL
ncbi:SDR family NAD(P)-dependent oxidoreductase [Pelagibacterium montanilacus]|uniref:SDR family NAD(P)-dependent oxidoreductase n=1 Tax=Pelagibacterium montanilacus TaxID=2185280 RepID=UPI000F8E6B25|nr:SDR family oxidoreductase [Pelagibacterium montanilacus]